MKRNNPLLLREAPKRVTLAAGLVVTEKLAREGCGMSNVQRKGVGGNLERSSVHLGIRTMKFSLHQPRTRLA